MSNWIFYYDPLQEMYEKVWEEEKALTWDEIDGCSTGDIAYIYSAPQHALIACCEIEQKLRLDDEREQMLLRCLRVFDPAILTEEVMEKNGFTDVGHTQMITAKFAEFAANRTGMVEEYKMILCTDEAENGCKKNLTMRNGIQVRIPVPKGMQNGQTVKITVHGTLVLITVFITDDARILLQPKGSSLAPVIGTLERALEKEKEAASGTAGTGKKVVPFPSQKGKGPNMLLGLLGAILGALLASIVWIILFQMGLIAGIAGIASAYCVFNGYIRLARGIDRKGVILCVIVLVIAIYLSLMLGFTFTIMNLPVSQISLSEFSFLFLRLNELFWQFGDLFRDMLSDFLMAYLFSFFGCFSFVRNMYVNTEG